MPRQPGSKTFKKSEVDLLIHLVGLNLPASAADWRSIAVEYNNDSYIKRNMESLRIKWKSLLRGTAREGDVDCPVARALAIAPAIELRLRRKANANGNSERHDAHNRSQPGGSRTEASTPGREPPAVSGAQEAPPVQVMVPSVEACPPAQLSFHRPQSAPLEEALAPLNSLVDRLRSQPTTPQSSAPPSVGASAQSTPDRHTTNPSSTAAPSHNAVPSTASPTTTLSSSPSATNQPPGQPESSEPHAVVNLVSGLLQQVITKIDTLQEDVNELRRTTMEHYAKQEQRRKRRRVFEIVETNP